MTDRLEIRLDADRRRKLNELTQIRQISVSDLVRTLLDEEYEEWLRTERIHAAEAISALAADDVPEPEVLDRQLGEVYDPRLC